MLEENKIYKLEVDVVKRLDIVKNYMVIYLLYKVLREIVGIYV